MKRCTKCGEEKPETELYSGRNDCKQCKRKSAVEWGKSHRERKNAAEKHRRAKDRGIGRKAVVARFGITEGQYRVMLEEQGGVCASCGEPEVATRGGHTKLLAIDHCHETDRIRGLLCQKCNCAIGLMQDDPELLRKAAEYLEREL